MAQTPLLGKPGPSAVGTGTATSGDVSGGLPGDLTVVAIQNVPVCTDTPDLNDVLTFDGTNWCPAPPAAGATPDLAAVLAVGNLVGGYTIESAPDGSNVGAVLELDDASGAGADALLFGGDGAAGNAGGKAGLYGGDGDAGSTLTASFEAYGGTAGAHGRIGIITDGVPGSSGEFIGSDGSGKAIWATPAGGATPDLATVLAEGNLVDGNTIESAADGSNTGAALKLDDASGGGADGLLSGGDGAAGNIGGDAGLAGGSGDGGTYEGSTIEARGAGAAADGRVAIYTDGSYGIIGQALVSDGTDKGVWGQEAGAPFSLGSLGATASPDRADGEWQYGTLTDDTAITLVGVAGLAVQALQLELAEGAGGFTPSFTNLTFIGTTPTWDTTPATSTIVIAMSRDGGTTWIGGVLGGSAGVPATTVTDETTWGITPAVGTDTEYARQDHTHGSPPDPGSGGLHPILVTDTPAGSPLIFADLLQNDAGTDLLYAD